MEHETDVAPGLDPSPARLDLIRERITAHLIGIGFINDPRTPPQSNSAQAFVYEFFARSPEVEWDDQFLVPSLTNIILEHNHDPHDTDVIGTVIDLMKYIRESVM